MMWSDVKRPDLWEQLENLTYTTRLGEGAPRADQVFYQHLQEGIENDDLDKIYEFIDASERGMGPRSDELVCKLFQKAYAENPFRLCQLLAKRNSIVDYWLFLTTACDIRMIQNFVKQDVPYPRFYFECARILLKQLGTKCEDELVCAVQKIANTDLFMWRRWIHKNEHNMAWEQMLPHVLGKINEEALQIYAQTINLDMSIHGGERGIMTQGYQEGRNIYGNDVLQIISSIVWNRWCSLLNEKKNKMEFQNRILITGYTDLVLDVFEYTLNGQKKWKSTFLKYGEVLKNDMNAWYESYTNMMSIFFYDITQIYYILYAGIRCEIVQDDDEIHHCSQRILGYISKYDNFWEMDDKQKTQLVNMLEKCG